MSSLIVAPSIDADTISRFAEFDRAGRTYESAIAALVAEGEAVADALDESLVVVTSELEAAPPTALASVAVEPVAIIAPEPERAPAPDVAPEPVALPRHVVTPAQPMPAVKRPHSVAVIVARGADF